MRHYCQVDSASRSTLLVTLDADTKQQQRTRSRSTHAHASSRGTWYCLKVHTLAAPRAAVTPFTHQTVVEKINRTSDPDATASAAIVHLVSLWHWPLTSGPRNLFSNYYSHDDDY